MPLFEGGRRSAGDTGPGVVPGLDQATPLLDACGLAAQPVRPDRENQVLPGWRSAARNRDDGSAAASPNGSSSRPGPPRRIRRAARLRSGGSWRPRHQRHLLALAGLFRRGAGGTGLQPPARRAGRRALGYCPGGTPADSYSLVAALVPFSTWRSPKRMPRSSSCCPGLVARLIRRGVADPAFRGGRPVRIRPFQARVGRLGARKVW